MKATKAQIRTDIQALLSDLATVNLSNAEQIAALLREPKSDDPSFPSGAYIRLMLGKSDKPDPSERFCDRFYGIKAWVEKQLSNGSAELIAAADKLIIRDNYDPTSKIRFVTTGNRALKFKELAIVEREGIVTGGLVYIPPDWIGQCHAEDCATFFLCRSASARYCNPTCRRKEHNRRQRERRARA